MYNYKLLLVGCFPDWEENTSCSFFSDELAYLFSSLPHVDLLKCHFNAVDLPDADFALVHAYSEQAIDIARKLKSKVKKSCYFMENYFLHYGYDHYWFYDSHFERLSKNQTFIDVPLVKKYYDIVSKKPATLLLDHDAKLFPFFGDSSKDWNARIWDILKNDKCGYQRIAQLGRSETNHPDFIEVIPKQKHQSYIEATKDFETYFVTHTGSYNHTAVDMAIRGIRTIVPKGFIPKGLVEKLGMIEVETDEQIISVLKNHGPGIPQLEKATALEEIVGRIDAYFRYNLKSNY